MDFGAGFEAGRAIEQRAERDLDAEVGGEFRGADDLHHFPSIRNLPLYWQQAHDVWTFESLDERFWEVVCAECGDDDGPAERQSAQIRRLGGPYRSARLAKRVVRQHRRSGAIP